MLERIGGSRWFLGYGFWELGLRFTYAVRYWRRGYKFNVAVVVLSAVTI